MRGLKIVLVRGAICKWNKFSRAFIVALDLAAQDVVIPAMDCEAAFGEGLLDISVGLQVI